MMAMPVAPCSSLPTSDEIDAIGGELALGGLGEIIGTEAADEAHIAAELSCGDRLVGALAAEAQLVFACPAAFRRASAGGACRPSHPC
jgi:hypothetical protein